MPDLPALSVLGERMGAQRIFVAKSGHQHFVDHEFDHIGAVLRRIGVGDGSTEIVANEQNFGDP